MEGSQFNELNDGVTGKYKTPPMNYTHISSSIVKRKDFGSKALNNIVKDNESLCIKSPITYHKYVAPPKPKSIIQEVSSPEPAVAPKIWKYPPTGFNKVSETFLTDTTVSVNDLKIKLYKLLKDHPKGLDLQKLGTAFHNKYDFYLSPNDYNCKDLPEILDKLTDVMEIKESFNCILLFLCSSFDANSLPQDDLPVPPRIISRLHALLEGLGGAIPINDILTEYERTGEKLSLSDLGFSSLYRFIESLGDSFGLTDVGSSQFYLYSKIAFPNGFSSVELKEEKLPKTKGKKKLPNEIRKRILDLVSFEFPNGLRLSELKGMYYGFYGYNGSGDGGKIHSELEPTLYGYNSLEKLLSDQIRSLNFINRGSYTIVELAKLVNDEYSEEEMPVKKGGIIKKGEKFGIVDPKKLLPTGCTKEVVVGEVFSPRKFWVIFRGIKYSQELDDLLERMAQFYSVAETSGRFRYPSEEIELQASVVIFFSKDGYYYRGIILSIEDLSTVKVFFVDYGSVEKVPLSSLRVLHRTFFNLPAQAMKARLYGVLPPNDRSCFNKKESERFVILIQNKVCHAHVHDFNEDELTLTLLETEGDNDVSIGHRLIEEYFAVKNPKELLPQTEVDDTKASSEHSKSTQPTTVPASATPQKKTKKKNEARPVKQQQDFLSTSTDGTAKLKVPQTPKKKKSKKNKQTNTPEEPQSIWDNKNKSLDSESSCPALDASKPQLPKGKKLKTKLEIPPKPQQPLSNAEGLLNTSSSVDIEDNSTLSPKIVDMFCPSKVSQKKEDLSSPPSQFKLVRNLSGNTNISERGVRCSMAALSPSSNVSLHSNETIRNEGTNSGSYHTAKSSSSAADFFYSDEERQRSPSEDALLPIENEVISTKITPAIKVPIVLLSSVPHVPLAEINFIFGFGAGSNKLVDILAQKDLCLRFVAINHLMHFDVFMQLARLGLPYIFPNKTQLAIQLELISLDSAITTISELQPNNVKLIDSLKKVLKHHCPWLHSINGSLSNGGKEDRLVGGSGDKYSTVRCSSNQSQEVHRENFSPFNLTKEVTSLNESSLKLDPETDEFVPLSKISQVVSESPEKDALMSGIDSAVNALKTLNIVSNGEMTTMSSSSSSLKLLSPCSDSSSNYSVDSDSSKSTETSDSSTCSSQRSHSEMVSAFSGGRNSPLSDSAADISISTCSRYPREAMENECLALDITCTNDSDAQMLTKVGKYSDPGTFLLLNTSSSESKALVKNRIVPPGFEARPPIPLGMNHLSPVAPNPRPVPFGFHNWGATPHNVINGGRPSQFPLQGNPFASPPGFNNGAGAYPPWMPSWNAGGYPAMYGSYQARGGMPYCYNPLFNQY